MAAHEQSSTKPLWGVGTWLEGNIRHTYPVGVDDIDRDTAHAERTFDDVGIEAGDAIVFTFSASEEAQFWPFQAVAVRRGAVYASAEPSEYDAARLRMFSAGLKPKAVFGVTTALLDGLVALEAPFADVLGAVPAMFARPGACARLRAEGVTARAMAFVGPAVALECAPGAGAHLTGEWTVEAHAGELHVSSAPSRVLQLASQPTGCRGEVITDPCACGRTTHRVVIEGC